MIYVLFSQLPKRTDLASFVLFAVVLLTNASYGQNYSTDPNGLPLLSSNSGAAGKLYIDFDGGNSIWDNGLAPYGGDSTFDATEQSQIYNAWLDVSTHFAMFDLDVTTIVPNTAQVPTSTLIVSPDITGGYSAVGRYGSVNNKASAANNSSAVTSRSTAISHEFGHNIRLQHQADYDEDGNYVNAYRKAIRDPWNRGVMMGVDFQGKFAAWAYGPKVADSLAVANYQDDFALIASTIIQEANDFFGSYSGDGFRTDDHGNDTANATTLTSDPGTGDLINYSTTGIIERLADTDMYAFSHGGGVVSIHAEAIKNLAASPVYASSVGMDMSLYDSNGSLLASDVAQNPADVTASLYLGLAPGDYYVGITSHGEYEDRGAYELDIEAVALGAIPFGDLNEDTMLNALDWMIFISNHRSDLGTSDPDASYLLGDMDGDLDSDIDDFILFRQAYEDFNGLGSFAAMTAGATVPEPNSMLLLAIGAIGITLHRVKWIRRSDSFASL